MVHQHVGILSADQPRVENIRRRVLSDDFDTSSSVVKQQQQQQGQQLFCRSVSGSMLASSSSARLSSPATSTSLPVSSSKQRGDVHNVLPVSSGSYVVAVGLGTPSERFLVELDTGSNMAWVQCEPSGPDDDDEPLPAVCNSTGCWLLKVKPRFNPDNSSTYANIPCTSPSCAVPDTINCCPDNSADDDPCVYLIEYADTSFTTGYYSQDTLILGHDTIEDFRFGCSNWTLAGALTSFGRSAGVMGLARGESSLTMQAYDKYSGVFAYCLPADPDGTGFLHLGTGAAAAAANASQTPMLTNLGATFYYVALTGIKVGGRLLPIDGSVFSTCRTILDSGTVITRLPPSAYSQLRSAFAADMEVLGYNKAPAGAGSNTSLDTCFDLTGLQGIIPVPTVSLLFRGGASLDVDGSGILYPVNLSQACLAFAANDVDTDVAIIGSMQQKTYMVLYDVGHELVGFAPGAC